jgi:Flp pilus assembly protein TadD
MRGEDRNQSHALRLARNVLAIGVMTAVLAACSSFAGLAMRAGDPLAPGQLPANVEALPSDRVLPAAKQHFKDGNYGHAVRYYEQAVELDPNSGEAWLGLAASYDRVRRFDLADRAYEKGAKFIGERAEYFNNVGYSYLLRGDLRRARQNFQRALELDPDNLTIQNNLEQLRIKAGN